MVAARPYAEPRATRVLVAVSIVSLIAVVAGYIAIIRSQGGPPPDNAVTVPFVAGSLLAMAVLLAVSLIEWAAIVRLRAALRGAAAGGLLLMGVLAIFSIGLVVLIAGALAAAATVLALKARPSPGATLSALMAGTVVAVVLGVGFEISWRQIVCPATGQVGGSTVGFFGSFNYECNNGKLTITSS